MGSEAEISKIVEAIADDRTHGAHRLSMKALEAMGEVASKATAETVEDLLELLFKTARLIATSRLSMAPITNNLSMLIHRLSMEPEAGLERLKELAMETVTNLIEASHMRKIEVVKNATRLLKGSQTVITISRSSTVEEVLTALSGHRVIVAESRPLFEGRTLAEELAGKGVEVTLIVDAAMGMFVDEADAALVGTDSVLADGSIVNKVGTKLLAIAAKEAGVPFYVVCDSSKFDVRSYMGEPLILETKDPTEVAEDLEGVEVRNPYFEVTPAYMITGIIAEQGLMRPPDISEYMESMKRFVSSLRVREKTE